VPSTIARTASTLEVSRDRLTNAPRIFALADGASDPLSHGRKRTPPLPGGDAPIAASSAAKGTEAVAPRRSFAQSTLVSTCSTALPAMPFSAMAR
jgi:hypothetical protein